MEIENIRDEEEEVLEFDLGDADSFYVANNRHIFWSSIW